MSTPSEIGVKSCFVIGPIGDRGSEIRARAERLLETVIRPAVEPLGYEVRSTPLPGVQDIVPEVMRRVLMDDLVVADLTGGNPNVVYELALRHVQKTPLVQLIRKGEEIPFDLRGTSVLEVDLESPDDVVAVVGEIREHVRAMEEAGGVLAPRSFDLPALLARIPSLLWPERATGPSRADWKGLVQAVGDAQRETDPAARDLRLANLKRSLETLQRAYAPRRPGAAHGTRWPGGSR